MKWDYYDKLLAAIAVLFALFLLWVLVGCATQKAEALDLIWISEGKCIMIGEAMSAQQAGQMEKDWNFADCDVTVKETQE